MPNNIYTTTTIDPLTAEDTITLSAASLNTDWINNISINTPISGHSSGYGPYTIGASGSSNWTSNPVIMSQSGTIDLTGERADIRVNGESVMETLKEIKEALKIPGRLARNTQLEAEFEDLQALAQQYEELVKKYKDQKRVWDILKREE